MKQPQKMSERMEQRMLRVSEAFRALRFHEWAWIVEAAQKQFQKDREALELKILRMERWEEQKRGPEDRDEHAHATEARARYLVIEQFLETLRDAVSQARAENFAEGMREFFRSRKATP
jgi:hypothetical protein